MIAIDQLSHDGKSIPLGQPVQFGLRWLGEGPPPARVKMYLRSNGVLLPTALLEWSCWEDACQPFWLSPESPGEHVLCVRWAPAAPGRGSSERRLDVRARRAVTSGPRRTRVMRGVRLWVPSAWQKRVLRTHERDMLSVLPEYLRPGSVIYDIGASLGLYAVSCGRIAGRAGRVYCFEANPVCIYFLRANLVANGIAWSEILPVALSDRCAQIEFTVNHDNLDLGLDRDSALFAGKPGHRIQVAARDLDGVVEELDLRPPDLVKVDIEGAEAAAVRGMTKTLAGHRPVLLLELHGKAAAAETLALLDGFGYAYRDCGSGQRFTAGAELVARMPDAPIQVVATQH